MILFLILIIISPIIAFFIWDYEAEIAAAVLMIGVMLFSITNVIAYGITDNDYDITAKYEEKQYEICGLENKTSQEFYLDGEYKQSFFIGYGSIHAETETEMNYFYFKKNEYGKILESVPINEAYIREKEYVTPSLLWIVEERCYKGHPILSKLFFFIRKEDEKQGIKTGTILEVPTNTIKIEYNVDI